MVVQESTAVKDSSYIVKGPEFEFPYTKGIGATIFEKLKNAKEEIVQVDAETGEKDTYEAFTKRCVRTAMKLRSKGLTSEDIITICSSNHLNTCVPIVASFLVDVRMANTDPNVSAPETAFLLNQIRPKIIFVSTDSIQLIEEAVKKIELDAEIVVFGETTKYIPFSEYLVETEGEEEFSPVVVDDLNKTAAIYFSSGTTGMPKGICVRHRTLLGQTIPASKLYKLPNTVVLATSPLYWISFTIILLNTVFFKACRVIVRDMTPESMWQIIEKYKVTALVMAPSRLAIICQTERPENVDISSLRLLTFGGAPFTEDTIKTARKMFPTAKVFTAYGQTEVGVATNFRIQSEEDLKLALSKPMSSGRVAPGYSIKIVDVETRKILGPNQKGEICVKTEYAMNGYYGIDASDQWDEDGFVKTGDLGHFDEDNYLFVTDRIKEMMKFQNWHIAPIMLEKVLMSHPAVKAALVIGIPHPIDNEHPMGLVVLKDSCKGTITAEELTKYVNDRVDNIQKLRAGVKIVEAFAETPTEKYKRKHMRDLVLAGKL